MQKITLLLLIIFILASCEEQNPKLKSVKQIQNDTIVGLKLYDKNGRITFDKTTQIIEDWNNDLMTWISADFYSNDKKIISFYAHSNLTLNKTVYDYDAENNLRETYTVSVIKPKIRERNLYKEIYSINNPDTLRKFIENKLTKTDTLFKTIDFQKETEKFYISKTDESGILTKEFGIVIDSFQTSKTIEKYKNNKLISSYHKSAYNENLDEFKYDEKGNLIEEIENWDLNNSRFQKKVHIYDKGNLVKTNFYHDKELAFTYEYEYEDTLLIKEIKTRLTKARSFKNRKKKEIIEYEYKYYE